MKRKKYSVGCQVFWTRDIAGLLWICTGITGMFGTKGGDTLHYLFLGSVLLLAVALCFFKWEKDDEMSQYNYMKAKAQSTEIMHFVYCVAMILFTLLLALMQKNGNDVNPAVSRVFFVIIGIQNIIIGIVFHKLEAE